MKCWVEIDYEYNGEKASCAEWGFETACWRAESLTRAGAIITRMEVQNKAE